MDFRKYPQFSKYKIPEKDFIASCDDSSTWLTWQIGISKYLYKYTNIHYSSLMVDPINNKQMGEFYICGTMIQMIEKGFDTVAKLSKEMNVKPTELVSILRQISNGISFEKGGILSVQSVEHKSILSKIDPRAFSITNLRIGKELYRQSAEGYCGHKISDLKLFRSNHWDKKEPICWYRNRFDVYSGSKKEIDESIVINYYLLQYLLSRQENRISIGWNERDKKFDLTGNIVYEGQSYTRPQTQVFLLPSKNKAELSLYINKNKIETLTWWSDITNMLKLFKNEEKRMDDEKHPVRKFKNDELVCAT